MAERWGRLTTPERRAYLVAAGITVEVRNLGQREAGGIDGKHTATLTGDPFVIERGLAA